ncbi:hypothetical protein [Silvanigrella aquatica]|uniref:Uncharacterized protein n=1 Tax=Silvanigrella aquatica TaxID=1915309 RepID=A0A1L4D328_9BACT|nr:hypothetical protein [Silvanigrella aquatica]APJ04606.1 hypothetical protein AXG55_12095 [Silvanigrella aquatica]
MNFNNTFASLFSIIFISGCGNGKSTHMEKVIIPPPLVKENFQAIYAIQNEDGTYSTNQGIWEVPEHVKTVKIIGCSGGNGGGGGGAGGAGATFFDGNWNGSSEGGNGSHGGAANKQEISPSGNVGTIGTLHGRPAGSGVPGGYPKAVNATVNGGFGEIGELTYFGDYIFKSANENEQNFKNTVKTIISEDIDNICLGGMGGVGGAGGIGGRRDSRVAGNGGQGGNGIDGNHALMYEKIINVTPFQKVSYQVGRGGRGGSGSSEVVSGQFDERTGFFPRGGDGSPGQNGQAAKPGVLYIQWVGL